METLILGLEDVCRVVRAIGIDELMDRTAAELRAACRSMTARGFRTPARSGFAYREPSLGLLEWMPAMDSSGRATIKIVGYHPNNPDRFCLPTILSALSLFDTDSGHLAALLDGAFVTAIRTGAASLLASQVLARPESRVLGLIGCGAQAVAQLHALTRSFPIEAVLLYDIDPQAAASFPERAASVGAAELSFHPASVPEVASQADIICTCTSVEPGLGPVLSDSGLRPWAHINAVGADFAGKIELPRSLLERAFVCADFPEQCLAEGECQQLTASQIGASLVELLQCAERYSAERERLTVFDSTGWALEDHVTAQILVREARARGVGVEMRLEPSSDLDPRNPYAFLESAVDAVETPPELALGKLR